MNKFERLAHAVLTIKEEGGGSAHRRPLVLSQQDFFRPLDFDDVVSKYADTWFSIMETDYLARFLRGQLTDQECRYIGFREQTRRPELIRRTVLEVAGTVLASQLALQYGLAANLAGGTHHAHPKGGAGYTIINDLAVTAHALTSDMVPVPVDSEKVKRVLIIDCDVHQGDGSAKFGDLDALRGKLSTLSVHCASNYPHPKAYSTYDVGLSDGIGDDEYLEALSESAVKAMDEVRPDLVLYDAGVDVYEGDSLGRFNLSCDGIRRRDRWVLDFCVGTARVPVAAVIGGGYDNDVDALARRHMILHEECAHVWRKYRMWERAAAFTPPAADDDAVRATTTEL